MEYENPWQYQGKAIEAEDLEGHVAFVYRITNIKTQKSYIGKKLLQKTRTKTLKGKRKKIKSESDWKTYYGSNKDLQADVEKIGATNFRREILKLCKSKGTANYYEMKYQIEHAVLENPETWYNEWIIVKVHRSHIKS
jgi:uncharacterized protein (DUF427 family)